jgi:two-component system sensor histidine kinase RegB
MDSERMQAERTALRSLAQLRGYGVVGYGVAVAVAIHGLGLPIRGDVAGAILIALAAFALYARARAQRDTPPRRYEVLLHVAVDILALTALLFIGGGTANPFVSLYFVPIALLAFTLPVAQVWTVAGLCALGYSSLWWAPPLAHPHHSTAEMVDLHLIGMWLNFLLGAGLMTVFATRIALVVGGHRASAARAEGVLAVATQAAATVHELNTPLSSVAVVLTELRLALGPKHELAVEIAAAEQQIEVCRGVLRRLSLRAEEPERAQALHEVVASAVERVALLRGGSAAETRLRLAELPVQLRHGARIEHLLINLLNNALDASHQAGRRGAEIRAEVVDEALRLEVIDHGGGWRTAPADFHSDKPTGLGLGLTLVRLIVEQYGGTLELVNRAEGGCARVVLPLAEVAVR